jgi:uncharacterized PurR-regulated membrane protein YhhQ (DUF165 family)
MTRRLQIAALVALFLAAIVAANLTLTNFGPGWILPNAFFLIGLDFITRDRLADFWGTTRFAKMAVLIAAGGVLSYWLNDNAAKIAIASTVSFCAAELVEAVSYHLLRREAWADRAPKAALTAAVVDSIVFPTMAFGTFVFTVSFGQFCAKLAGATFWTWVVARSMTAPTVAPTVPSEAV